MSIQGDKSEGEHLEWEPVELEIPDPDPAQPADPDPAQPAYDPGDLEIAEGFFGASKVY